MINLQDLGDVVFEYGQNDSYLTFAQAWEAKDFMKKHLLHIFRLIKDLENGYPPTLQEDKNNPSIWKAEHWFWFIQKYIKK